MPSLTRPLLAPLLQTVHVAKATVTHDPESQRLDVLGGALPLRALTLCVPTQIRHAILRSPLLLPLPAEQMDNLKRSVQQYCKALGGAAACVWLS